MYIKGNRREGRIISRCIAPFSQGKVQVPMGSQQGSDRDARFGSRTSLCTPSSTTRTPFSPQSSLCCCSSDFRCGKRRRQTLPKCGNPPVPHCPSTPCSCCCHSVAQRGLVCPLHLPDTSGSKNNSPPLLPEPICWTRQPPLTSAESTSLLPDPRLGGKYRMDGCDRLQAHCSKKLRNRGEKQTWAS